MMVVVIDAPCRSLKVQCYLFIFADETHYTAQWSECSYLIYFAADYCTDKHFLGLITPYEMWGTLLKVLPISLGASAFSAHRVQTDMLSASEISMNELNE